MGNSTHKEEGSKPHDPSKRAINPPLGFAKNM